VNFVKIGLAEAALFIGA